MKCNCIRVAFDTQCLHMKLEKCQKRIQFNFNGAEVLEQHAICRLISSFVVTIETTTAYVDGRRNVDKRHCCVFCGMYVYRLPRHYQRYHRHHPRVAALKEKSGEDRNKDLDRFRLEGAYKHNIKVLTENKGSLILPRRPSTEDELRYSYEDYLHCEYCLGFFLKHNLWRHQKNCQFKTEDNPKGTKRRPQRNAVLLLETALQKDKSVKPG